jgi:hypothetical protein
MFEKENAFFEANFPALLEKYNGKELVIAGDQIVGVYDSFGEACDEADKRYTPGSVCIKHVDEYSLEPQYLFHAFPHPLMA